MRYAPLSPFWPGNPMPGLPACPFNPIGPGAPYGMNILLFKF